MEIITTSETDEESFTSSVKIELKTNDKNMILSFYDGEPEDNNLGRNFNDVYLISEALQLAYEAGKRGEPIITTDFQNTIEDSDDELEDDIPY
jgi:hypothetical protein